MRHLSQKEAQNERDFFSKKKNGKFTLINHRDFIQYPQLFMVTGHDDFQSGSLGITRNKHTTHIKVKVSGPAGLNIGVRFVGGHYHKGKNTEDFVFNIPTMPIIYDGACLAVLIGPGAATPAGGNYEMSLNFVWG